MIRILKTLKSSVDLKRGILFGLVFFLSFFAGIHQAFSQSILNGKVFETGTEHPLEGVSVVNKNSQTGELTDRSGYFSLDAKPGDSIEIKLLGYLPQTFAMPFGGKIINQNIFLTIKKFQLKSVEIMARPDFRRDSLQNREENASIFNYKKPNFASAALNTVFHPLSGLNNLLNAGKRKRLIDFQDKLETQEQDRYIDSRYTRQLVSSLSGLHGKELETFMKLYRPSFEYIQAASDYDLFSKIKDDFKDYVQYRSSKTN